MMNSLYRELIITNSFMVRALKKLGIEGMFLNIIDYT
jgi:hypothetical protein